MILTKISHEIFNNGDQDLETKTFLKHDLVHFAIDQTLGVYDSQYPTIHTAEIEQVAGIMHSVYDTQVSNAQILEGAKNMFSAQGKEVPVYFTDSFIDSVRNISLSLLEKYHHLKTGDSIELSS